MALGWADIALEQKRLKPIPKVQDLRPIPLGNTKTGICMHFPTSYNYHMGCNKSLVLLGMVVSFWSGSVAASVASEWPALQTIPNDYHTCPGTLTQVKTMPEVRSQDGMSICYAMVAWTLTRQYECRRDKILKCETPPAGDPKITSVLDLAIGGQAYRGEGLDFTQGGSIAEAVEKYGGGRLSEACFNWDQFINQNHDDPLAMVNYLQTLHEQFDQIKSQIDTEAGVCINCQDQKLKDLAADSAAKINAFFPLSPGNQASAAKILDPQIKNQTFQEFLENSMIPLSCRKNRLHKDGVELGGYPEEGNIEQGTIKDFNDLNTHLNKILSLNRPVGIGACLNRPSTEKQRDCDEHGMVVAGTSVMCQSKCPSDPSNLPSGCKHAVQIINSWGQDWQDTHHQGWMDADNLYPYVDKGPNALLWIEDRPPN